ncbi:hypothetical protein D039_3362A, partial [Vibrio parahaemolyticus EKP-028]
MSSIPASLGGDFF